MLPAYNAGRDEALRSFGQIKTAAEPATLTAPSEKPFFSLPTMDDIKGGLIGNPSRVHSELQAGTIHKPGGALHEAFLPQSGLGMLWNYGMPAYSAYQMFSTPGATTGRNVGNLVGSTAGGILGSPLGMIGSTLAGSAMGNLGTHVGGLVDKAMDSGTPPPSHASRPQHDRTPLSREMGEITGRSM